MLWDHLANKRQVQQCEQFQQEAKLEDVTDCKQRAKYIVPFVEFILGEDLCRAASLECDLEWWHHFFVQMTTITLQS